jgi:hypothetical protein
LSADRHLHLSVDEHRTADVVRREVTLRADGESGAISILYEIFDSACGELPVLDGFVLSVLFHCMRRGWSVRVHGDLSESGLRNLHEVQRAWSLWRPEVYRVVDLIPDRVVAERPRSNRTIQAFSCGVDATFTLLSNKYLNRERGGYDVTAGLLVHGFDVAYDNTSDFAKLADKARRTLDQAGVELKLVRTNSRTLNVQSWQNSNTAQLAACLHQFSSHYGRALLGSAEPYDVPSLGVGANPITDNLLSGDLMAVVHDGAGYSRTEKVEAISRFPFFVDQLKVCWEGRSQHENCGVCEKCIRTRLNFAAAGHDAPSCFEGRFEERMLRKLRCSAPIQIVELEGILTYVRRRGLSYPWTAALRRRILLSRLALPLREAIGWAKLRSLARSALHGTRRIATANVATVPNRKEA